MIARLEEHFLHDDEERTAAREGDKWYTPAMLLRRERLWRDDKVQAALEEAWTALHSAISLRLQHGAEHDTESLSWPAYNLMSTKLYLTLMHRNEPRESFLLAKLDFAHDTRDWPDPKTKVLDRRLSKSMFLRSWFELADLHTDAMDPETYAGFLTDTVHTIVKMDPDTGAFELRPDAEIMELGRAGRHSRHRAQRLAWARKPMPPSRGKAHYEQPTTASVAARRDKHEPMATKTWEMLRAGVLSGSKASDVTLKRQELSHTHPGGFATQPASNVSSRRGSRTNASHHGSRPTSASYTRRPSADAALMAPWH